MVRGSDTTSAGDVGPATDALATGDVGPASNALAAGDVGPASNALAAGDVGPANVANPPALAFPAKRPFRYHAPVHSPLSAGALAVAAATTLLRRRTDPRDVLAARIRGDYHADDVVLTDSGTTALRLAIELALGPENALSGGEHIVALPAFTCYDVATAAVGAGARIALYDLDPATLAPDPDSLAAAFRLGARAAVVAPLYGVPVDWEVLERLARSHDAILIEDAAQGHGALWRGRPLGSLGRLAVISFGRGKGWTGGAGGALLRRGAGTGASGDGAPADRDDVAHHGSGRGVRDVEDDVARVTMDIDAHARGPVPVVAMGSAATGGAPSDVAPIERESAAPGGARSDVALLERASAASGWRPLTGAAAQWLLGRPALYGVPASLPWLRLGDTVYRDPSPPRAMPRAAAALALATRDLALREAAARRARGAGLRERLGGEATGIRVPADAEPGFLRLPVRIPAGRVGASGATRLAMALRRFGAAPAYPTTLAALPAVQARLVPGMTTRLDGGEVLVAGLITLPTHTALDDHETDALLDCIAGALR